MMKRPINGHPKTVPSFRHRTTVCVAETHNNNDHRSLSPVSLTMTPIPIREILFHLVTMECLPFMMTRRCHPTASQPSQCLPLALQQCHSTALRTSQCLPFTLQQQWCQDGAILLHRKHVNAFLLSHLQPLNLECLSSMMKWPLNGHPKTVPSFRHRTTVCVAETQQQLSPTSWLNHPLTSLWLDCHVSSDQNSTVPFFCIASHIVTPTVSATIKPRGTKECSPPSCSTCLVIVVSYVPLLHPRRQWIDDQWWPTWSRQWCRGFPFKQTSREYSDLYPTSETESPSASIPFLEMVKWRSNAIFYFWSNIRPRSVHHFWFFLFFFEEWPYHPVPHFIQLFRHSPIHHLRS